MEDIKAAIERLIDKAYRDAGWNEHFQRGYEAELRRQLERI